MPRKGEWECPGFRPSALQKWVGLEAHVAVVDRLQTHPFLFILEFGSVGAAAGECQYVFATGKQQM